MALTLLQADVIRTLIDWYYIPISFYSGTRTFTTAQNHALIGCFA